MDVKKGIMLYDLQYPNHNAKLLKLWEKYLVSEKWDYLIYGGDIMDMDAISHHALKAGDIRSIEGKRLKDDYEFVGNMLRRHRELVYNDCETFWLQGNHEDWAEKLVDKIPGLEGMIEVENNLPLSELDIKVIKPRGYLKLGKIHFIHGDIGRGYTPVFHAKKVVETYNRNVVYGHHHTLQTSTKLSPLGIEETHTAHSIPCMADTTPKWNQGKPTAWLNGFGVFYVTNTAFTICPIVAAKDSFITPEGKLYK